MIKSILLLFYDRIIKIGDIKYGTRNYAIDNLRW